MRAWVLYGANDLRLEEVPTPVPRPGEVLVSVKAAGICGSDIPRIYRTGAHVHPLIPGHEFSGVVAEVGPETDKNWLGKRVGIFPLIPCGACGPCRGSLYELCRDYSYLGSRQNGGFAEYAAVPAENLLELPEAVSFEAAAMLEPMAVAVHALRRLGPGPGETVAVCGLGTIGLLLVMVLLEAGIKNILAVGNKDFQRQALSKLGIAGGCFCSSRDQDAAAWLLERSGGRGVDAFFECAGKNDALNLALRCAAPGGKICLLGNPDADLSLEKNLYWKILRNQLTVIGTWNSGFSHCPDDDWHYVLDLLSSGRAHPAALISHRFSLAQMQDGLDIMRNKREDYVKIMGVN